MAAGTFAILNIDQTPSALRGWHLLKAPVTSAETALTATQLMDDMRSMVPADDNSFCVVPVSMFDMIQCMQIGFAGDNDSPVLDLYGWGENGPGHHIGTLTTDLGSGAMTVSARSILASSRTQKSIRDAFDPAQAWVITDQYVVTLDAEQERITDGTLQTQVFRALNVPGVSAIGGTIGTSSTEANFPQVFNVDFSHSDYSYFGVAITNLGSATSAGLIFRPIRLKGGMTSPGGV
jgi:hypothetical protein